MDAAPIACLPLAPGVCRFRDAAGRALYVGRAVSLRRRVASYWGDLGDRRHLAVTVARIARVEVVPCDSAHEAAWLERNLLQRRLPPWNRSPNGGQEAEVWIRLSASARAPGLTVVHQPGLPDAATRYFGRYLGGQKVRDAVSGLGRVLPLGYAVDAIAGTARDLQAEIEALAWITGAQKVTQASPYDLDVHGWADGMLVSLEIRGGRLSGWRQRRCGTAAARPHLAQSPPPWAPFAGRAAVPAARLTRAG